MRFRISGFGFPEPAGRLNTRAPAVVDFRFRNRQDASPPGRDPWFPDVEFHIFGARRAPHHRRGPVWFLISDFGSQIFGGPRRLEPVQFRISDFGVPKGLCHQETVGFQI